MLVLSRKAEEQIAIGNGIRITVLSVRGNRVRLGIHAPDDVTIHRLEMVASFAARDTVERECELAPCQ